MAADAEVPPPYAPPSSYSSTTYSFLISSAAALALYSFCAGVLRWWTPDGATLLPSGSYGVALAFLIAIVTSLYYRTIPHWDALAQVEGWSLGLVLCFLSDWLCRSYSLLPGPIVRGEIILFFGLALFLIKGGTKRALFLIGPIAALLLATSFIASSHGKLLFSDDHSVFFYRLSLLKENFPHIPFYNPLWNGGIDARDFFATGALNIFFITSPLWYLLNGAHAYNASVITILFVLLPFSTFLAARYARLSLLGSMLAPALALSASLLWYRWALKYGTMGFVSSTALLPLVLILGARAIALEERFTWRESLLFTLTFSLMLLWSPSGLAFVPLILIALYGMFRSAPMRSALFRKPVIIAGLLIVLINLPWITALWSVSRVTQFLASEKQSFPQMSVSVEGALKDAAAPVVYKTRALDRLDLRRSLHLIQEDATKANPVILFLLIPGVMLLTGRTLRIVLATSFLWLLIVGALLAPLKPQLELDRMLLMAMVVGAIPAAHATVALIDEAMRSKHRRTIALAALTLGFVVAAVISSAGVVRNKSIEHYVFADETVEAMANAINRVAGDGRIIFSGFVLHELSSGHLAPLTIFSKHPLVASSPFHDRWRYRNVIPGEYLSRGDTGIREYLDAMNASAVFTHERDWRLYFTAHPQDYTPVWQGGRFILFKRNTAPPGYFIEGSGAIVDQSSHNVTVRLSTPHAVIKFNYFPFLKAGSCKLSPYLMPGEMQFIRLDDCPVDRNLTLETVPLLTRIVSEVRGHAH